MALICHAGDDSKLADPIFFVVRSVLKVAERAGIGTQGTQKVFEQRCTSVLNTATVRTSPKWLNRLHTAESG